MDVNALLPELLPVLSTVAASGFGLTYVLDRRKRRAEATKTGADAQKAAAEGQVAISGTALLWAQRADSVAERATMRAELAEKNVLESLRTIATLQERIEELEAALDTCQMQLVDLAERRSREGP